MDTSPSASSPEASATWQRWADDLSKELGTPITYGPLGFRVRGVDVSTPEAVRAIAGR